MTVTVADFRTAFPEFASTARYPDTMISPWLLVGARMVNADRWGDLTDLGIQLHAAHNIVLARNAAKSAATGATPGQASGVLSAKSIDKVSASYDVAAAAEEGAGFFNLTTYGQRYWHFAMLFGAGGMQL